MLACKDCAALEDAVQRAKEAGVPRVEIAKAEAGSGGDHELEGHVRRET